MQYLVEGLVWLQLFGVEDIVNDCNVWNILECGIVFVDEEMVDYYIKVMARKDSLLLNIVIYYFYI